MTGEEIQRNVARIRQELAEASEGRWPVPKLIAVTKTHSPEEILPLAEAGVTEIGENRVQELNAKLPGLENRFRVHLIGRLQRNKVKQVIGNVCMIQSVDSVPLAEEIHNRALVAGIRMPVLVEVSPAGRNRKAAFRMRKRKPFSGRLPRWKDWISGA